MLYVIRFCALLYISKFAIKKPKTLYLYKNLASLIFLYKLVLVKCSLTFKAFYKV